MIKRLVSISLIWVFLSIISFSCIDDCSCSPAGSYRVSYEGINMVAYQTQGFGVKPVIDTAFRFAFGIDIRFQQNSERIALSNEKASDFFIPTANACDCVTSFYEIPDPIDQLNLYLINPSQGDTTLVSDKFRAFSYGYGFQQEISLDSIVRTINLYGSGYYHPIKSLMVELAEPDLFIGQKQIMCAAKLRSGRLFESYSSVIFFK